MIIKTGIRHNLLLLAGLIALAWLIGLVLFVSSVERMSETPVIDTVKEADAIVVLTGGSDRIASGLELLRAGKGKRLFISGVHPKLSLDRLIANQPIPKDLRARIDLGHATDTIGNADETRGWVEALHYSSMLLVTSNYHMARSLLELRAAMPGIVITPYPVAPPKVKLRDWWLRPGTTTLLVTEYGKYLAAILRLRFGNS